MICSHLTPEKIHSCLSVPLIDRLMTQPAFSAITHYSVRISLTQSTAYITATAVGQVEGIVNWNTNYTHTGGKLQTFQLC